MTRDVEGQISRPRPNSAQKADAAIDCGGGSGAWEESSRVDGRSITTPTLSNHGGPRQEEKQSRYRERQATFGRFVRRHRPLLAGLGCPRPVVIGWCGQGGSPGTGLAAGPARREGKLGEAGGCLLAAWLAWPLEGCWQLLAACPSHLMLLVRPACFSTDSLALLGPQSTSLSRPSKPSYDGPESRFRSSRFCR